MSDCFAISSKFIIMWKNPLCHSSVKEKDENLDGSKYSYVLRAEKNTDINNKNKIN